MSSKSSRSDPLALPEFVTVGAVRRPHGIRGEVHVNVFSDVEDRFEVGSTVFLTPKTGSRLNVEMTAVRRVEKGAIVGFRGIETRGDAEKLRGATLEIARTEVPPAPEGSYYYFELIGCRCTDRSAGPLGIVDEVIEDGGGLLLEIEGQLGRLLVPFVDAYLVALDIENRRIVLELPKGLIETCVFRS